MNDNFDYIFVKRTLENLKNFQPNVENKYEIIDLINQCYGLIIVPKEFAKKRNTLKNMNKKLDYYGVNKKEMCEKYQSKSVTISNFLRHVRNALSHVNISLYDIDGGVGVEILDADLDCKNVTRNNAHTIIRLNAQELKTFAIKVAEEYCRLKEEELK